MLPTLVTLFERKVIEYQTLGIKPDDPLLDTLDRLNRASKRDLIKVERHRLLATQYVGVLQTRSHTIQILPKIDCDPDGDPEVAPEKNEYEKAISSAAHNFLHLLTHTHGLKFHHQVLSSLQTTRGSWLELLTQLFARELMLQLQQGFHHDYVQVEEQLPYIRGRWNIARQFIRQPEISQRLDVSYDEYSPDTLLNQVFHYTADRLQWIAKERYTRQMLADLCTWLLPVYLPGKINAIDLDRVHFSRLNERFKVAFQLARLFLESQTVELLPGGQPATAFVFDMDLLFQDFVANLLKSQSKRILPRAWEGARVETQGGKTNKYLVDSDGTINRPLFHLKPDILISLKGRTSLIIDTKNKALPIHEPYRSIAESDAYQMLAYATRFNCPNVLLLYPSTKGAAWSAPFRLPLAETQSCLYVANLNLHQPLEKLDALILELRRILDYIQNHEPTPQEVL